MSKREYRTEHVAATPRGWKVRTVTAGDHEVRIAFPPGRRVRGSGHVVEILHPPHENPSYCPGASRMRNPAELVLMGANPLRSRKRNQLPILAEDILGSAGGTIAAEDLTRGSRRQRSNVQQHYAIRWHTGNISNSYPTKEEAERVLERFHAKGEVIRVNPLPLHSSGHSGERYRNPIGSDANAAREIREGFVHGESNRYSVYDEPHVPAGDYALLGTGGHVEEDGREYPAYLEVKPASGGAQLKIDLDDPAIRFISSSDRRQIYVVGRVTIDPLDFNEDSHGTVFLGVARGIAYIEAKYHPQIESDVAGRAVLWQHKFGEESGEKPDLFYDTRAARLMLRGGAYRVEDAGIVN